MITTNGGRDRRTLHVGFPGTYKGRRVRNLRRTRSFSLCAHWRGQRGFYVRVSVAHIE
jgi:hypothetical protein